MTWFSSLGARRLALLAVLFVIGVACAKVDREYYDEAVGGGGGASAGAGGTGGNPGSAGVGTAGKAGGIFGGDSGSAGEAGAGGSSGENAGGEGGTSNATLTVVLGGDGKGVVTSDISGINCGTTCKAAFDPGTEIVLTATPAADSTFVGWSGECSGTGTCTVLVSEMTEVTARFTAKPKLTVTLAGNGSGTVKSVPEGIDCGTRCTLSVTSGSSVSLTATPATGSVFSGWTGGGCTGTGPCNTTLSAATSVTATFTLTTQTLTVLKSGTGVGTVSSVPSGIDCGADCSEIVNYGSKVTLTAAPTAGTSFSGWTGGGCSGTGTCIVTVTAATQVTATFTCAPGSTTLNYTGAITSFTVPACVTSLTIDAYGAQGGSAGTYAGGLGARMKGTFAVTGGQVLKVLVGGKGLNAADTSQQAGGSGGGGTFITYSNNSPLIVAGAGGGAVNYASAPYQGPGINASIGTAGTGDSANAKAGGVNGNGGPTGNNLNGYHPGTGGGGLLSNGVGNSDGSTTNYGGPYGPGFAFINGGAGGPVGSCAGAATTCIIGRVGGFGGGGAAGFMGGGGGGYSGGAGGSTPNGLPYTGGGGGGGSYNAGTAQTNVAGARAGDGLVVFTY